MKTSLSALTCLLLLLLLAQSNCSQGATPESAESTSGANQLRTNLTLDAPTLSLKRTMTLHAKLTDVNGNPVKHVTVEFQVNESIAWSQIGQTETDDAGSASQNYEAPKPGAIQVRAVFDGTSEYAESSSEPRIVNVDQSYQTFYIAASAAVTLLIGAAVGFAEFRLKIRKQSKPQADPT